MVKMVTILPDKKSQTPHHYEKFDFSSVTLYNFSTMGNRSKQVKSKINVIKVSTGLIAKPVDTTKNLEVRGFWYIIYKQSKGGKKWQH
jgi:hypothetical protein